MKKKIVVPEGMLKTAIQESRCADVSLMTVGLQSALRWLIENPILVSDEVAMEVWGTVTGKFSGKLIAAMFQNIQRRMFLAPEQEVPEALKDLLIEDENYVPPQTVDTSKGMWLRTFNQIVIEAYRRGQKNSV